jgi:hypothetical protein
VKKKKRNQSLNQAKVHFCDMWMPRKPATNGVESQAKKYGRVKLVPMSQYEKPCLVGESEAAHGWWVKARRRMAGG